MKHVSHFNQRMAFHLKNEAFKCKVAIRWFDELEESLICSYEELARAFEARFATCSMVPKPLDSLLSMVIREGETLKTY